MAVRAVVVRDAHPVAPTRVRAATVRAAPLAVPFPGRALRAATASVPTALAATVAVATVRATTALAETLAVATVRATTARAATLVVATVRAAP